MPGLSRPCSSPAGLAPTVSSTSLAICALHSLTDRAEKLARRWAWGHLSEVNRPARTCDERQVRSVAIRSQERGVTFVWMVIVFHCTSCKWQWELL